MRSLVFLMVLASICIAAWPTRIEGRPLQSEGVEELSSARVPALGNAYAGLLAKSRSLRGTNSTDGSNATTGEDDVVAEVSLTYVRPITLKQFKNGGKQQPTPEPSRRPETQLPPFGGGSCNDAEQVLNTTNNFRALHGVKAYKWSTKLATQAQGYCDSLVANYGCSSWQHSAGAMRGAYGENLYKITIGGSFDFMSRLQSYGCSMAVNAWYGEIAAYKWDAKRPWSTNSRNFGSVGHFTALVWASTTQVGCGQSVGSYPDRPLGCKVICCQYLSAGNVATDSYFKKNVKPLLSSKKKK
jgi:hypothetical protein